MTGYVVVISGGSWPQRVIGPLTKENAEKLAMGYQALGGADRGANAVALPIEAP